MTRLQLALIACFCFCSFVQSKDELKANGTSQQRLSRSYNKWLQSNYNPYVSQNPWLQQQDNHYYQQDRTLDFFGDFQGDGSDATFRSNHYNPRGESEGRFFSMKKPGSLFYNKAQLFSQLINNKPINPNVIYPNYGSCTSSNGLVGICTLSAVCSLHHGTAGGSCTNGGTCCVNLNPSPVPSPLQPNYGSCTSTNGLLGVCTLSSVCASYSGTAGGSCTNGGTCCINFNPSPTPSPIQPNYGSCTSTGGLAGICTLNNVCSAYSGTASGSCTSGGICCVNFNPNPNPLQPNYGSCTSSNGLLGTCTTSSQCSAFSGTASGSCGSGGACCVNFNPNPLQPNYGSCASTSGLIGTCTLSSVCSAFSGTASGSCGSGGTCCVNFSATPNYGSCTSTAGLTGTCTPSAVCSFFGGNGDGSCASGGTCCVNVVKSCGSAITLNGTYWQSPTTINSGSACALTIKLNSGAVGAGAGAIAQVRLDFISFSIGQPDVNSVCSTDTFTVSGASNNVPIICGNNAGQHMYLTLPTAFPSLGSSVASGLGGGIGIGSTAGVGSGGIGVGSGSIGVGSGGIGVGSGGIGVGSGGIGGGIGGGGIGGGLGGASGESDLQLQFTFGSSTTPRSWNIRVSMLPSGASYLAPSDVLQYFTGSTGTVSSFNFALQAPSATAVRQLAYQKYKIGYRSEVIGSSTANSISFTPCTSTTTPLAVGVSLSGDATSAAALSTSCTTDFLTLISQTLSISGGSSTLQPCDRLCGVVPVVAGQSITSTVLPFRHYYQTDGNELGDVGNNGFCLNYQQSVI